MNSILTSIKKLLGIVEEYKNFDVDIIMHINSAFSILTQLGVGPEEGFRIKDTSTTWYEFLYNDRCLEFVKTYIYLKVKLSFDPPSNSAAIEAINRQLSELEWRINVTVESESSLSLSQSEYDDLVESNADKPNKYYVIIDEK